MLRAGAFALLLGAMAAMTARAATAAELSLLDIRFGAHTETTRVVLDLSGPPRYRAFALSQPPR
ncbi:MAG: N-acetylmuramoyl-L-alanine amidase, partial [Alphaproteobacteria bacterium]|nr:N-acetylmuramoyl-L-alanine amidase [Alphaproteobacteria bacterium]